jgi:hypothetical protein
MSLFGAPAAVAALSLVAIAMAARARSGAPGR